MAEIPLKQHIAPSGEQMTVRDLASCPPPEKWDDWVEYDARAWPRKVEKHCRIIPTICFNCEAAFLSPIFRKYTSCLPVRPFPVYSQRYSRRLGFPASEVLSPALL